MAIETKVPETDFNTRPESTGGLFMRLAKDGESVTLRIVGTPYKKSVHWKDNKPYLCGKVEEGDTCVYCEDEDEKVRKIKQQYYYLSLIRKGDDAGQIKIFQTVGSVHWKLCDYKDDDYNIFQTDWIVKRTGKEGSDFYTVKPTPKAVKLTKEDKETVLKATKEIKLEERVEGVNKSESLEESKT